MVVHISDPVIAPCPACGKMAAHHPYVKPMSPWVGLVCARCGHLLEANGTR